MRSCLRIPTCLILTLLLLGVGFVLDSRTASADFEVNRSAGTRMTGGGNRKSNDLGSKARGRSSMSSRSSATRSGPSLPSDDDDDDEGRDRSRDRSDRYSGGGADDDEDRDEDEFERDSAPTLGRACIYGTAGEVVYRPRGSWCRGDTPPPHERERKSAEADSSGSSNTARRAQPAAASAYRAPERPREKKVKRKTSAGCLYGKGGEVLFAPATSDCVNGIGAPSR